MSGRLKSFIGLVITVGLLWWVLRDVSFAEVAQEVRRADPWLLCAMVVVATLNFLLRAIRWGILLEPEFPGSSLDARFGATSAGFAANNIFPARLGELVRAYVLGRVATIPFGACLGSLVVERVLDGLVVASLLLFAILSPGFPVDPDIAGNVRRAAVLGSIGFVVGFVVLWAAAQRPDRAVGLWKTTGGRLVPGRFSQRVTALVETIVRGLAAVGRVGVLARALVWSYAVWLALAASIWLGMQAFGIEAPGFVGALFVQAIIAFAVALPSTPGFVGVFEWGARMGLAPWDIAPETIVSFATSYHILTFIPITLIGLWYLRRFGLKWSDVGSRADEGVAPAASEPAARKSGPR